MLNNATPSRPHARRRSADTAATGGRPAALNLDIASTARSDAALTPLRRGRLAA